MLTETEAETQNELIIPDDIEEFDAPPEVVARWDKIAAEAHAQIASGELVPMTAAEFAAEVMRKRKKKNNK